MRDVAYDRLSVRLFVRSFVRSFVATPTVVFTCFFLDGKMERSGKGETEADDGEADRPKHDAVVRTDLARRTDVQRQHLIHIEIRNGNCTY